MSVSRSAKHGVRKTACAVITLEAGLGVTGDVHAGELVRHRYDRRRDPTRPNERQIHLIADDLYAELAAGGFELAPGDLGENVTTRGLDLMALPVGARLRLGAAAVVELRMLREPCVLLDRIAPGLCAATTIIRHGAPVLRHGVLGIVVCGGVVERGNAIRVDETARQ
jgi:MOSC domain-containing protein YiiM